MPRDLRAAPARRAKCSLSAGAANTCCSTAAGPPAGAPRHVGAPQRWCRRGPPPRKHDHVDVQLEGGKALRLTDPRRFGAMLWLERPPSDHALLRGLGLEPLEQRVQRRGAAAPAAGPPRGGQAVPHERRASSPAWATSTRARRSSARASIPRAAPARISRGALGAPRRGGARDARARARCGRHRRCAISPPPTGSGRGLPARYAVYGREGKPCRVVQGADPRAAPGAALDLLSARGASDEHHRRLDAPARAFETSLAELKRWRGATRAPGFAELGGWCARADRRADRRAPRAPGAAPRHRAPHHRVRGRVLARQERAHQRALLRRPRRAPAALGRRAHHRCAPPRSSGTRRGRPRSACCPSRPATARGRCASTSPRSRPGRRSPLDPAPSPARRSATIEACEVLLGRGRRARRRSRAGATR